MQLIQRRVLSLIFQEQHVAKTEAMEVCSHIAERIFRMSKKKRFGISEALTRGLSETINVVENNAGIFRNVVLPLSRIELRS